MSINGKTFPRSLCNLEFYWLNLILPENRLGYKAYKEKIEKLLVIGYGKNPPYSIVLGNKDDLPDLSIPQQSVVAYGFFSYDFATVEITLLEEFENQIELEIFSTEYDKLKSIDPNQLINAEKNWFTYSEWSPGMNHPFDHSSIREVKINDNITLAISSKYNRIWIFDKQSGMNIFIPITNFYQEVLSFSGIRDLNLMTDYKYFFKYPEKFSDDIIYKAFLNYNRKRKKVNAELEKEEHFKKESIWRKILKRFYE